MDIYIYLEKVGEWALNSGVQVLIILILMMLGMRLAEALSTKLTGMFVRKTDGEAQKRIDTLSAVIKYVMSILIFLVAGMMILKEIGIDIGPMLAAAGVVGLAIGFGAQKLVEDVISGFFILLEDQIRVGDVVDVGGKSGLVEKVNLRMVILRDAAGNVHYVRNSQINIVTNMTKDYSRYVFEVGVAYRENVDEVIELLKQIDEGMRNDPDFKDDILEPLEIQGLDRFADSAVIIKARTKTKPIRQWAVGREFNKRMKKLFDEKNIEIPFPHMTLYMGEGKSGQAPALNVRQNKS